MKTKELSLDHWRFKFLHWCFRIDGPKDGRITGSPNELPPFMYTHFCPLFHVTNLMILLLPVVLLTHFLNWLVNLTIKFFPPAPKKKGRDINDEYDTILTYIKYGGGRIVFDDIWEILQSYPFTFLTREQAKAFFLTELKRWNERQMWQEQYQLKQKEKWAWAAEFSARIMPILGHAAFFVVLVSVLGTIGHFAVPVTYYLVGVCRSLYESILQTDFVTVSYKLMPLALIVGLVYFAKRIVQENKTEIADVWFKFKTFINVFYEENCPKIIIKEFVNDESETES